MGTFYRARTCMFHKHCSFGNMLMARGCIWLIPKGSWAGSLVVSVATREVVGPLRGET